MSDASISKYVFMQFYGINVDEDVYFASKQLKTKQLEKRNR